MERHRVFISFVLTSAALLRGGALVTPAITLSPTASVLRVNDHKTFTPSITGISSQIKTVLTWTVAPAGLGSVASGVYTAPAVLPASNTATITLTATDSATNKVLATGSAKVTLENPLPVISSLTPNSINTGLAYAVAVKGSGFIASSQVMFDGKPVTGAKFVSSTEIDLTGTSVAAAGSKIAVTVVNPDPGGATSEARTLTVEPPVAVTASPDNRTIRLGTAQTFSAKVSNNSNQNVIWSVAGGSANGTIDAKGVYTTPLVLPVAVPPAGGNTAGATTAPAPVPVTITAVTVADKTKSASVTLNLENAIPSITSVSPASLKTGSQTVAVSGAGFAPGAVIYFAGAPVSTTVDTVKQQLTATFNVALPPGGTAAVKVLNPAPGAAASGVFAVPVSVANPKIAYSDAVRFLEMASFGPTPASIQHLQEIGTDAWITEQMDSTKTPISVWPDPNDGNEGLGRLQDAFFTNSLTGKDQLRQRVAFALSEILVVSGVKDMKFVQMVGYLRLLNSDAFGHYRNLLGDISLNPAMGVFLDMVNNGKATFDKQGNPVTVANENYAREIMQLFSLGLVQLNSDGTSVSGNPSEYDQSTVTEMAKVFTGWTFASEPGFARHWKNAEYYFAPMVPFDEYHDRTLKNINLPTPCTIAMGGTAASDLNQALDCIAMQKNVAPFISYRLIQRLVKSNPTTGYVSDVAGVFANHADYGNLSTVIRAILTHKEALAEGTGKLREPVIQTTTLLRELDSAVTGSATGVAGWSETMGQKALFPASVFSYFSPFFHLAGMAPPPPLAPEFQAMNAETEFGRVNFAWRAATNGVSGNIRVNSANWLDLASDAKNGPALVANAINQALYRGEMTADELTAVQAAAAISTDPLTRVRDAVYVAAAAPQYQVAGTPQK